MEGTQGSATAGPIAIPEPKEVGEEAELQEPHSNQGCGGRLSRRSWSSQGTASPETRHPGGKRDPLTSLAPTTPYPAKAFLWEAGWEPEGKEPGGGAHRGHPPGHREAQG